MKKPCYKVTIIFEDDYDPNEESPLTIDQVDRLISASMHSLSGFESDWEIIDIQRFPGEINAEK
jgi:hypothetical protein